MQRRILTSTLALLTAMTAVGAAQASTNVTVPSYGSSHISDTGGDEWTKDTKWGDIGTYFSTGYDLYSTYNGSSMYEMVSGEVGAVIFDEHAAFASISLKAHAGQSSSLKADCDLYIFGAHLINMNNLNVSNTGTSNFSVTLAQFTSGGVDYSANGNWSVGGGAFSVSVDATMGVEAELSFMGIPIVLSAGASGEVGVEASGSASYSGGKSTIDFTGEPFAELNLSASAGVGTGVASAGVTGSLTLLHVGLPVTNTLSLTPGANGSGTMQYATSGYLSVSTLGGEIGLYLHAGIFTYSYTLFDWDGVSLVNKLLFTDSVPVASSPKLTISGNTAKFSYIYADANPELNSIVQLQQSGNASGTVAIPLPLPANKTYSLTAGQNNQYLRGCVTPKNGVNSGAQVCTDWTEVGPVLSLYKDSNLSGTTTSVAYQHSDRDRCYNVSDLGSGWNDTLSSFRLNNESGCNTMLYLWKDANCSGSAQGRFAWPTQTVNDVTSLSSAFGSSWNDEVSSFKVSYCEEVSASNVSVSFEGQMAVGTYDLQTNALLDVDTSTARWSYATSSSGSGATDFFGGTLATSLPMTPMAAGKYIRFCVTPTALISSGSEVCSGWADAPAVTFYKGTDYSSTGFTFPFKQSPSGTCYNMTDLGSTWNDVVGSLALYAPANGSATLHVYKNTGCSGTEATTTAGTNATTSVANVNSTYGSGWNDAISSFKVVY